MCNTFANFQPFKDKVQSITLFLRANDFQKASESTFTIFKILVIATSTPDTSHVSALHTKSKFPHHSISGYYVL